MLFKWLFTLLAVIWLIQAVRPYLEGKQGERNDPAPPPTPPKKNPQPPDENDYIDYEEIK